MFLIAWILAAAIVVGAAALFLLPSAFELGLAGPVDNLDAVTRGLVLLASVVLLGFTMAAASTPLYRLLEGYSWCPEYLRNWCIGQQRMQRCRIQERINQSNETQLLQSALLYERLARYPVDHRQIAPTRLGNALRAMETYGLDRYQLDSQAFWSELQALSPKALQDELDNARSATDFFVAMVYLTPLYGLVAVGLAAMQAARGQQVDPWLIAQGAATLALGPPISYRLAVSSTTYWRTTVQAMVNIGRLKLARAYGLVLPSTLEEERRMWGALGALMFFPYDVQIARDLDPFRRAGQQQDDDTEDGHEVDAGKEPALEEAADGGMGER